MISVTGVANEFYAIITLEHVMNKHMKVWHPQHRLTICNFYEYKNKFINKLAHHLYDYITLCCVGEARHAYSKCSHMITNWDIENGGQRSGAWSKCLKYNPEQLLQLCDRLYNDYIWGSSFGGKKWGQISSHGLKYNKEDIILWVDHCFDLQHNGGTFFDKQANIFECDGNVNFILNMKNEYDAEQFLDKIKMSTFLSKIYNKLIKMSTLKGKQKDNDVQEFKIQSLFKQTYLTWGMMETEAYIIDRSDYDGNCDDDDYDEETYDEDDCEQYEKHKQPKTINDRISSILISSIVNKEQIGGKRNE